MAEKQTANKETYEQAVKRVISEYKIKGIIKYNELADQIATPFSLDATYMDNLIQRVEDAGIGVVGEDGNPTERQLKKKKRKKNQKI